MKTTKSELIDRAIRRKELRKIRKKNITEYFLHFSQFHRVWIKNLSDKYKACGDFPMLPMVLLPQYYDNKKDQEIAAFAALLVKEDDFGSIQAFREMIGKSPWKWFSNREFVRLSVGALHNEKTGGVWNWKIAKLMDRLWGELILSAEPTYREKGICEAIDRMAHRQCCSRFDVLTYLMEDCGVGHYFYKLRMLLMVMCSDDGFGLSLWKADEQNKIKCPIAPGIKQFVETWFPDWKRIGDLDNAIRLLGFERESDFFYAWLGYKKMQKKNPKECGKYATRYRNWYDLGSRMDKCKWIKIQPEILF